ncbi:MAG: glycerol-3-phosphate acyltransferase, partial [Rhodospirillaceae bacterium]|nr:glycerol-3-phosphate acyltransferase [Rhodospirillaceae bacterium]
MTETVEIPVWLLLIIAALAVLAALDDVLLPTARWYLRRHVNKVIDDVNDRLRLELPTFQITKRRVLIDRLIYDPEVMKTVGEVAAERGVSRDSLTTEVSRIAREMVPAFNAYFYFRLGYR